LPRATGTISPPAAAPAGPQDTPGARTLLTRSSGLLPVPRPIRHISAACRGYAGGSMKGRRPMIAMITTFLQDERGVVSVDWTTLSAGAIGLALATAGLLTGAFDVMISRVDGELRDQQLNDGFIKFTSAHFEALYENNLIQPAEAESLFGTANDLLNHDVLKQLQEGLEKLEAGELTSAEDIANLIAIGSVAWQRNLVDDPILDYYFGFGGNDTPRLAPVPAL
jgi:hypothetical protein